MPRTGADLLTGRIKNYNVPMSSIMGMSTPTGTQSRGLDPDLLFIADYLRMIQYARDAQRGETLVSPSLVHEVVVGWINEGMDRNVFPYNCYQEVWRGWINHSRLMARNLDLDHPDLVQLFTAPEPEATVQPWDAAEAGYQTENILHPLMSWQINIAGKAELLDRDVDSSGRGFTLGEIYEHAAKMLEIMVTRKVIVDSEAARFLWVWYRDMMSVYGESSTAGSLGTPGEMPENPPWSSPDVPKTATSDDIEPGQV